ncbi:AraC family transcriptional regulator [Paenibacillus sp. HB172176]|uniref:helix-turn-helix transcriptional regulator n=1 Tax=Paenibacillus sp. HB172176 TaxID=2493690 RepID=UPI0014396EFC|nr:AraC family transcriptional regulator [Paenibacillus sp. HB172176]
MAMRIEHIDPENSRFFLVFKYDQSERLFHRFHAHQGLELLFIHEGKGRVEVEGRSYTLEGGSWFCFQPYQLHKLEVQGGDASYLRTNLTFDPRLLEPYLAPYPKLKGFLRYLSRGVLPSAKYKFEDALLTELIASHAQAIHEPGDEGEESRSLFLLLLLRQLQLSASANGELAEEELSFKTAAHIELIMDWLEECFREPFRLERLAEELHLSPYYVSHLFKQHTGATLSDYIAARRVREACELLGRSDKSVSQIAAEIGSLSAPYFGKLFKKHKSMTPLEYRAALLRRS